MLSMAEEKNLDEKKVEEKSPEETDDVNFSAYDSAFTALAGDAVDEGLLPGIVPSLISICEKIPFEYVVNTFIRRVRNRLPRVIPRAYKTKMEGSHGYQEQRFTTYMPEKNSGLKAEFKLKLSVPISITVIVDKVKKKIEFNLGRFGVSHWMLILTTCVCLTTIAVYCGGEDRREEADRLEEADHEDEDNTEVFVLGPEHGIGYIRLTAGIGHELEVYMHIPE